MKPLVLAALAILALTGCSSEPTPTPTPTQTQPSVEVITADVYFVIDAKLGFRLVSEKFDFTKGSENTATQVIRALISGGLQANDPDYKNLWDTSNQLNSITVSGNEATVDIKLGSLNVGAEAEMRAIDQILYTLTGIDPSIKEIRFLVNGEEVESLAGHVDAKERFRLGDGLDVLLPVQISSITESQTLSNPVSVSGEACTFEAQVSWSLKNTQNGDTWDGTTTATTACPNRSPFKLTLPSLTSGTYQITVRDISAKDGSIVAVDDKTFTIK